MAAFSPKTSQQAIIDTGIPTPKVKIMLGYAPKAESMLFMLLTDETLCYLCYLLKRYAIYATEVELCPKLCLHEG